MTEIKMQAITIKEKLLSIKPTISEYKAEYKAAVEEREKKIAEYQQEISELHEAFAKAFGSESINLSSQSILKLRARVDPKELESAILQVVDKKPNLLTKEIHQEIISSGLQVIEETVRRKLEDLLKNDKIEKTDPSAERSVRYKIKSFIAA
jgi:hypothetical protein